MPGIITDMVVKRICYHSNMSDSIYLSCYVTMATQHIYQGTRHTIAIYCGKLRLLNKIRDVLKRNPVLKSVCSLIQ